jgi:hypothetical protein
MCVMAQQNENNTICHKAHEHNEINSLFINHSGWNSLTSPKLVASLLRSLQFAGGTLPGAFKILSTIYHPVLKLFNIMLPPIPTSCKQSSPSVQLIGTLISPMHATCICPHDQAPLCDHPNSGLWREQIMKCPEQLWGRPTQLPTQWLLLWGWSG